MTDAERVRRRRAGPAAASHLPPFGRPPLTAVPLSFLAQARVGATGGVEVKYEQQLLEKLFDLHGKTAYVTGAAQGEPEASWGRAAAALLCDRSLAQR